jgi:predicted dehydrogenase
MKDRWNCDPKISGGGVLIDNGSHSVDIARYLLGPVVAVQAQPGVQGQGLPVEDTVNLWLRTARGVVGTVDLSWTIHKETPWYVSVFGSAGAVNVGWKGSQYKHDGSPGWVAFGTGYDKVGAFKGQLQNFVDTVRGKSKPLMGLEDALASVRVIEAAYRSVGSGKWESVEAGA